MYDVYCIMYYTIYICIYFIQYTFVLYNIHCGTLNTAFFDIFTMNKAAKKMNMLL